MLTRYHATHTLRDSEAALFHILVRSYAEVAAPYLATCFGRVYNGDSSIVDVPSTLVPLKELLLIRAEAVAAEAQASATEEVASKADESKKLLKAAPPTKTAPITTASPPKPKP